MSEAKQGKIIKTQILQRTEYQNQLCANSLKYLNYAISRDLYKLSQSWGYTNMHTALVAHI